MSHVTWPSSLQTSTCGVDFCESLEFVSLLALTFGYSFNRSLGDVTLPSCLKIWIFGYEFTQPELEACVACKPAWLVRCSLSLGCSSRPCSLLTMNVGFGLNLRRRHET